MRKAELPAPLVGELLIRDEGAATSSFRRHVRVAVLLAYQGAYRTVRINVATPIWDPALLPAPEGKLLIRGIELDSRDGAVYEHEQLWLCTPTAWRQREK